MSVYFMIQGLYRGEWTTLFEPLTRWEAVEKYRELTERNPACRYRIQWRNRITNDNPAIAEVPANPSARKAPAFIMLKF